MLTKSNLGTQEDKTLAKKTQWGDVAMAPPSTPMVGSLILSRLWYHFHSNLIKNIYQRSEKESKHQISFYHSFIELFYYNTEIHIQ